VKRFILFAGDFYYPGGGAADFISEYDHLMDAKTQIRGDWSHILDTQTGTVHETQNGEWTAKLIREFVKC
jgi:hypothetical protein